MRAFAPKQNQPQKVWSSDLARSHSAKQSPPHQSTVPETPGTSGQPLDSVTLALMESRFGHNFSHVRVHTDETAAELNRSANSLALTLRNHLFFGPGQYSADTQRGQKLLAHELYHVVQQQHRSHNKDAQVHLFTENRPNDSDEREADLVSERVITQSPAKSNPGSKSSAPVNCSTPRRGGDFTTRLGVYECLAFRVPHPNATVNLSGRINLDHTRGSSGLREIAIEVDAPNSIVPTRHRLSDQPIAETYPLFPAGQCTVGFRMQQISQFDRARFQVVGRISIR